MRRSYNKSQEMFHREPNFDPAFWEIRVDTETLGRFSSETRLHYESEKEVEEKQRDWDWTDRMMPVVMNKIDELLTPRQKEIVRMYYLDQMTEHEIAGELGISASSVSQHLFGKVRGGKRVGGAIPKLRRQLSGRAGEKGAGGEDPAFVSRSLFSRSGFSYFLNWLITTSVSRN